MLSPLPSSIPDQYRFLWVDGIEYYIQWEDLHPGGSFFIKTVATPARVRAALRPVAEFLQMNFKVAARVEFGRYGMRIWRV